MNESEDNEMQIIITGGGGFLGQKLARALLQSTQPFTELLLVDIQQPQAPMADPRVRCLQADLTEAGVAESLITERTAVVYHLAAIVSSHAEQDFDLGWKVNLDTTRTLTNDPASVSSSPARWRSTAAPCPPWWTTALR